MYERVQRRNHFCFPVQTLPAGGSKRKPGLSVLLKWMDWLVGFLFHANLSSGCCSCFAGCADLNSLDSLSPQEKKRQGYIHELIETEEKYVEDLQIVLEVISHKSAE